MPTSASTAVARAMLDEARGYVERGWTQGASARDADGTPVEPWSARAAAWSTVGALVAVWAGHLREADDLEQTAVAFMQANSALLAAMGDSPRDWNDAFGRRRRDVLDTFDRALAHVEADRG